jgi:hypothetical protein
MLQGVQMILTSLPRSRRGAVYSPRLAAFAAVAAMASACSGGDEALPVVTDPPTTTTLAPVITDPPPTVASTEPAAPETSTTTEPAPTTTVPLEVEIQAAVKIFFDAYDLCGRTPDQCDPSLFTASKGAARRVLTEAVDELARRGLYFSPDTRGTYHVVEIVLRLNDETAVATLCLYDAGILLGPDGPDGQPTVVSDAISSVRYDYTMYLEAQGWQLGLATKVDELGTGDRCAG